MAEKKIAFSVLIIGLDGSGKTTMIRQHANLKSEVFPTAGFEIQYLNCSGINAPVLVYDCSGVGRARDNWRTFYDACDGIIFVIDSTDSQRVTVLKKIIKDVLTDRSIKDKKPILFAFNKQDEEDIMEKENFVQVLEINNFKRTQKNPISTKGITGKTGDGVIDCFQWIRDNKGQKYS
ncbi:hypothetical protein ABPG72_017450 [Tetrahymena utriculariae]